MRHTTRYTAKKRGGERNNGRDTQIKEMHNNTTEACTADSHRRTRTHATDMLSL